jgi:hypothetical protein
MMGCYKEGVIDICKDSVFRYHVINLLKLDDVCLLKDLHSEVLISLLVFSQSYSSKRP